MAAGRVADGADEARHEPGRCHGERREQQHADRTGDGHRIAQPHLNVRRTEREEHHRGDQQRPVQPDVSGAQGPTHQVALEHPRLNGVLDVEAEPALQVEEPLGVAHRDGGLAFHHNAEPEVAGHGERRDAQLSPGSRRLRASRRGCRAKRHRAPLVRHGTPRVGSPPGEEVNRSPSDARQDDAERPREAEDELGGAQM